MSSPNIATSTGRCHTSLHRPHLRRPGRRWNHHLLRTTLQPQTEGEQQHPCSRAEVATYDGWRGAFPNRTFLVRLVWQLSERALDGPTLSGLVTGAGVMMIFLQALNYLIDAYLIVAASAIAANSILRSFFGAGFREYSEIFITSHSDAD